MSQSYIELEQHDPVHRSAAEDGHALQTSGEQPVQHHPLNSGEERALFTSHALSTWNARTYEFAAVREPPMESMIQLKC